MRIAMGADHRGWTLKNALKAVLVEQGHEVDDKGTHSSESVDYPDFAEAVGKAVAEGRDQYGVLVCGTGIGVSIAANKVNGIRAALVNEPFSARMARQHNDANVVCMGGEIVGLGLAQDIVAAFLGASFEGGRHVRRIEKIGGLEKQLSTSKPAERR